MAAVSSSGGTVGGRLAASGERNGLPFRPYRHPGRARPYEPLEPIGGPGLCACGCGQQVKRATRTDARTGQIKGEFLQYARGHSSRCIRNNAA